jgi:hypothetical protein
MKWNVEGTHEHRGGNVSETIDARTQEDAVRQARRRGIIISRIEPRTNEVIAGELDAMVAKSLESPSEVPRSQPDARQDAMECDNCHARLGSLERPLRWKGHLLCANCYRRLSGDSGQTSPVRVQSAVSSSQRAAAVMACCGVVALIIGGWMLNGSSQTNRYEWMKVPGGILALLGLIGTFGGLLWFAVLRMRQ